MESSIFVEVRSIDGSILCYIERPRSFLGSRLANVRQVLDNEVGDLLPQNYKFCRRGIPVSSKQEESLMLQSCVKTVESENVAEDTCDDSSDYSLEIKEVTIHTAIQNSGSTKATTPLLMINRSPISATTVSGSFKVVQRDDRECGEGRGVEKSIKRITEDKEALRYKLDIARAKLVSLKERVPEREPIGSSRSVVCSNCHVRGHRVNKPCTLPACQSYFDCGVLNLHKDHKAKIQEQETEVKELQKLCKKKEEEEEEEEAFQMLKERSQGNFFRLMRDRLKQCNPVKYSHRPTLDNDLRVLAAACKHIQPSDETDLCALINDYRNTIRQKTGNTCASVFNSNSPQYYPYHVGQVQSYHPQRAPIPSLMSQLSPSPTGLRMGSPGANSDSWNAFGPYPRFADSTGSIFSPRSSVGSHSNVRTPCPVQWSPWNGQTVNAPQGDFHGMRPTQRQALQISRPDYRFPFSSPIRAYHTNQRRENRYSPVAHQHHDHRKGKSRRELSYNSKSSKFSKGEIWRQSLKTRTVVAEKQQSLQDKRSTTSQPPPLVPQATSTPNDENSDSQVNVVDVDVESPNKDSSGLTEAKNK